jgi:hypothetical protein
MKTAIQRDDPPRVLTTADSYYHLSEPLPGAGPHANWIAFDSTGIWVWEAKRTARPAWYGSNIFLGLRHGVKPEEALPLLGYTIANAATSPALVGTATLIGEFAAGTISANRATIYQLDPPLAEPSARNCRGVGVVERAVIWDDGMWGKAFDATFNVPEDMEYEGVGLGTEDAPKPYTHENILASIGYTLVKPGAQAVVAAERVPSSPPAGLLDDSPAGFEARMRAKRDAIFRTKITGD